MADIDASIERLDDALRSAGLDGPTAPRAPFALGEIIQTVAPYALPAELRRFWERVDPSTIAVTIFPELIEPSSALELHRSNLEPGAYLPPATPPVLFPFAYSSHVFRSVELASEWGDGGTVFRWAYDEDAFRISYPSISQLVDTVAELVAEGSLEHRGGFVLVSSEAEEEKQTALLGRAGPHPLYANTREFMKRDLDSWPSHWLESSGIDLRGRRPLGATHTIAALVQAAEEAPVRGRIAGTVIRLVGIGGNALVVVDDGTGPLDVWCPAGTSPWGPAHRRQFEFEVAIERPVHRLPAPDGGHRSAAVAVDIRPLD